MPNAIYNVSTNIISGFLGVGKTTAILNLFANKPVTEKWAVLVNEFGKIGIDGRVYQASGISVKEIPGGCMCCAQGLPLQVAVNRLLRETKPDRLIIESSGVGHPEGVLKTLKGEGFKNVLTLKAGICLVDARCLLESAYQHNELFKEQLQLADVLVANKTDLASAEALEVFFNLAESFFPDKALITTTTNGQLKTAWLDYQNISRSQKSSFNLQSIAQPQQWQTHSFTFPADTLFDLVAIKNWVIQANPVRLKGLIQTPDGCYLFNYSAGQVDLRKLDNQTDNHIEMINNSSLNIAELEQTIDRFILNQ